MAKRLPARRAQAGGGLFQLFFRLLQHRLHRAHHKGQPDEDERHHDARRLERQLQPQRLQPAPHPAIARQHRRQRNARHRRGQRKGQIHQRISQLASRKFIAHQHPGQQQARRHVHQRRRQRSAKRQPECRQHARRGHRGPEIAPAH